ncbi:MAG: cardiolipin synthase [Planctomycetota bacterium]
MTPLEILALGWFAALTLAGFTVPSVLLHRRGQPQAATSWLLALFAIPPLAIVAWWALGRTRLERRRWRRRRADALLQPALVRARASLEEPARAEAGLLEIVCLPDELQDSVFPPSGGNAARLLVDADAAYPAWEAAIRAARHHVHLLFYTWRPDAVGTRLRDLLCERAREGIEVRVLTDDVGSLGLRGHFAPLVAAGGRRATFFPVRFLTSSPRLNFRNHRKLIVVDGEVGFLGGMNIGEEYLRWHDLALELRGPAVDQLQEVFASDWHFACREELASERYFGGWRAPTTPAAWAPGSGAEDVSCAVVASGPEQEHNAGHELMFMALTRARRRVWISTPYLLPDAAVRLALRTAVYRGVDVRILVPERERNDLRVVSRAARAFYPELARAGIRLFEYPEMVHTKAAVFDDELAFVGSANLDVRSFRDNFELLAFLQSSELNAQLAALFEADMGRSRELRADELARRPYASRVLDAAAHLLTPLM